MSNRDFSPAFRRAIQIFAYRVVEADFAFFDQHHNGRGDKLFAERTDPKDCVRRNRDFGIHISKAISAQLENLPIFDHG